VQPEATVTRTVDEAVADLSSSDAIVRDQTIALLVSYGTRATAALLPLLDGTDPELRARAARALAYIADPGTADRLASLLDDDDPFIRSHAAHGLAQMQDPRALEALIKTIDDLPSKTQMNASQSTAALVAMGEPALARVADLLTAPSPETRARARLVILQVANRLPPAEASAWRARVGAMPTP
jgi:HEAT repeat protein